MDNPAFTQDELELLETKVDIEMSAKEKNTKPESPGNRNRPLGDVTPIGDVAQVGDVTPVGDVAQVEDGSPVGDVSPIEGIAISHPNTEEPKKMGNGVLPVEEFDPLFPLRIKLFWGAIAITIIWVIVHFGFVQPYEHKMK